MQTGKKERELHCCNSLSFMWYHQESNRGHKDFQSFALPTELWHHRYAFDRGEARLPIANAKVNKKNEIAKVDSIFL